ncbi:putative Lipid/polyisoprenoid-binding YceI-like domain-containing protein [Seiridium unicorne]|uniref:Lipid/polyisoprenoid-binding YceI-like domain-containing protein n=1 Tax=Seiridium unicorne TaxID=138068 RepID=A0ABR2UK39_9PEZI
MSEQRSGFPELKPAFIIKARVGNVNPFGVTHTGSKAVHIEVGSGTIETVPGFEPAFKAELNFGADWFTIDHDAKYGRVEIRAIAKTTEGFPIDLRSQGVIELTPPMAKIFGMEPDMATVPFGSSTSWATLTVADPALKSLENGLYAGNSRMIVDENGLTVEVRQSLIIASTAEK